MPELDFMQEQVLKALDPKLLGRRLQNARKARGLTQQEVSDALDVGRTTITAFEKGDRRVRPNKLIQLARLYGRQVGELVGSGPPTEDFAMQFRTALAQVPTSQANVELEKAIQTFRQLCEDYLYLEHLNEEPIIRNYPQEYPFEGINPEDAAEDIAATERNRLGLGDGPILNLTETFENDVGIRIFYMELPSRVAGIFAYTDEIGACVAVNSRHPESRRRWTLTHEYGHFLTSRYRSEVTVMTEYQRIPATERFAESFARSLLMPATGLRRRFLHISRGAGGRVTAADVCRMAHFYVVSVEAMMLRLEELRLVPRGTWRRARDQGFKDQEAQQYSELDPAPYSSKLLSFRYQFLAVQAYVDAKLTEGELAHLLRVDRVMARRTVQRFKPFMQKDNEGEEEVLSVNLTSSIRRVYGEASQVT